MCFIRWGDHTEVAYSRWGHIRPLYININISWSIWSNVFLAIASILLALFTAEFICLSKDSSWSIYMSRSFSQADLFSWCPSIQYSLSPSLDFFPIDIDTQFSGWNFSNHTDDQLYMFCKSVCNWVWSVGDSILLNTLVSSAKRNMNVSVSTTSGRSYYKEK